MADISRVSTTTRQVIAEVERAVVGKRPLLEMMMASVLAGGHILLEDFPGLGKTLLVGTLADCITATFSRIQFTLEVQQVQMEVETALRRAQAARDRYAAAAGGAEEGREALRVEQERRQAGLATLTDELETETAALGAALQEIGAASEVAIADAALKRAAGEI